MPSTRSAYGSSAEPAEPAIASMALLIKETCQVIRTTLGGCHGQDSPCLRWRQLSSFAQAIHSPMGGDWETPLLNYVDRPFTSQPSLLRSPGSPAKHAPSPGWPPYRILTDRVIVAGCTSGRNAFKRIFVERGRPTSNVGCLRGLQAIWLTSGE